MTKQTVYKITRAIVLALMGTMAWAYAAAADTRSVEGRYTYVDNGSHSLEECKRIALQRARIDALDKEFGTIVSQTTYQHSAITQDSESKYFDMRATTESKGEWLSDTSEPKYNVSLNENSCYIIDCRIKGTARLITNEAMDFEAEILKNSSTRQAADTQFKQGDRMYLYFRAPADGYVTAYLVDDSNQAWNLLPYLSDQAQSVKVKKDKEYYFFSPTDASDYKAEVDELEMTAAGTVERNDIYVLYSPTPFNKALDKYVGETMPRQLSYEDFSSWLGKVRKKRQKDGPQAHPHRRLQPVSEESN
ncbi:MAG: DUF4384 domain-containing protein [Bacteroidales bacterium]|nr:DUF4384 domain-containing protein [Bacteroidales bacterium]